MIIGKIRLSLLVSLLVTAGVLFYHQNVTADDTAKGTVFVVMGIDAESRQLSAYAYHQILNLVDFDTLGSVGRVMREDFRNRYIDSYGGVVQFTWFASTHQAYAESDQRDGTILFEKLKQYAKPMAAYGDMIGWQYFHADWESTDTSLEHGRWRQLTTFYGAKYLHGLDSAQAEQMVSRIILEHGIYPTVFRSGWSWESNELSAWLDDLVPFDFSNAAPLKSVAGDSDATADGSVFDWSKAPADWSWYHPDREDYQLPDEMQRTIFRIWPVRRQSDLGLGMAFAKANQGQHMLVCFYAPSYGDLDKFCRVVHAGLELGTQEFPGVYYKYVSAFEAAKRMLQLTDMNAPKLTIFRQNDFVVVTSDKPLIACPYGAVKDTSGRYFRVYPMEQSSDQTHGAFTWTFDLAKIPYAEFAIGACDQSGNAVISRKINGPAQGHH